jgi:hypothetical protein
MYGGTPQDPKHVKASEKFRNCVLELPSSGTAFWNCRGGGNGRDKANRAAKGSGCERRDNSGEPSPQDLQQEIRRYRSLVTDRRRRQPLPFRQPLLARFW